ncbi:hypothetical protein CI41S_73040 [Bradyrhizobium ivorense]|nr:hypothetical protein CI41S_73040 [Bradyrhizobium ivorense]
MPDGSLRVWRQRARAFQPNRPAKHRDNKMNRSQRSILTNQECEACFAIIRMPSRRRGLAKVRTAAFEADCTDNSRATTTQIGSINCIWSTGSSRMRRHDPLHHGDEALLVRLAETGHGFQMGRSRRSLHLAQQRGAGWGQAAELRPTIMACGCAINKATRLQPLKRSRGRRAIQRDVSGQGRLIGGSALRERGEEAVLQRRDLERCTPFLEQGDVDLMQPPDQVTRPLLERPQAFGLSASCCHPVRSSARCCAACMNLKLSMPRKLV